MTGLDGFGGAPNIESSNEVGGISNEELTGGLRGIGCGCELGCAGIGGGALIF